MSKKLAVIIVLQFIFIFWAFAQLTHDYKMAWRGLSIILGISVVMVIVFKIFKKPN